jgi:hypothetical protein
LPNPRASIVKFHTSLPMMYDVPCLIMNGFTTCRTAAACAPAASASSPSASSKQPNTMAAREPAGFAVSLQVSEGDYRGSASTAKFLRPIPLLYQPVTEQFLPQTWSRKGGGLLLARNLRAI